MDEETLQPRSTSQPASTEQEIELPLEVLLRHAERARSEAAAKVTNAEDRRRMLQETVANLLKPRSM